MLMKINMTNKMCFINGLYTNRKRNNRNNIFFLTIKPSSYITTTETKIHIHFLTHGVKKCVLVTMKPSSYITTKKSKIHINFLTHGVGIKVLLIADRQIVTDRTIQL